MQKAEENPAEVMLGKLCKGYGYSQGLDTMPQGLGTTCRKLYHAILNADRPMLEQILHPSNPRSREAFSALMSETGAIHLPKTVKGTNEFIAGFVARVAAALNQQTATS